ncbi:SpaA isopeptide-forming pilin-related protein [Catalinimonas alkaloidigena]|uniref:SpaA isopeptide-forming pilin-related protein n=1 Tax=Catalinimonas alkaloidigena TaxID=1075417 RepID=UPI0024062C27|nr:SpaA isopeptide-forming pilin-related protein [Catalinimonas alkaloidigena]
MKNVWRIISTVSLGLLVNLVFIQCEEDISNNGAILLVQVVGGFTWEPVAGAEVTVYRNVEDWAREMNEVKKVQTDINGEILLEKLTTGEYFFNVVSGSMNNWHFSEGMSVAEGTVSYYPVYITENINSIISSVEGKKWSITGVANELGEDISHEPAYACMLDNVVTFRKSGYYSMEEGSMKCDPTGVDHLEGEWVSSGDTTAFWVLFEEDIIGFLINNFTENSFSATLYAESGGITYHYKLIQ